MKRTTGLVNPSSRSRDLPSQVVDNLVVMPSGQVWAVFEAVDTWQYSVGTVAQRDQVLAEIEQMAASLPGESAILSVCPRVTVDDLAVSIEAGAGAVPSGVWSDWAELTASGLGDGWARARFLTFRVDAKRPFWKRGPATGTVVGAWKATADRVVAGFGPAAGRFRPADESVVRLLFARAFRRHVPHEPTWSGCDGLPEGDVSRLIDVDVTSTRRGLMVETPDGHTGFLAALTIADLPQDIVVPGGGEWLWALDQLAFPVDWAVVVRSTPNARALEAVRRKAKFTSGQVSERASESGGLPASLLAAVDGLDAEQELLTRTRQPGLRSTYVVTVGAGTAEELEDRVRAVVGCFPGGVYGIERPAGHQMDLVLAGLPGMHRVSPVLEGYVQHSLPDGLAAAAPLCGSGLGDGQGLIFGFRPHGLGEPVQVDLPLGPSIRRNPTPASIGLVGKTGSGKGVAAKTMMLGLVAAGAQVVAIDRTVLGGDGRGEYVKLGDAMPDGSCEVVELGDPKVSLDPLVCLGGRQAMSVAKAFLGLLAQVDGPGDPAAGWIAEAVAEVAAEVNGGRLVDVVDRLSSKGGEAASLGRVLRGYESEPAAASVFSREGRPMDLGAGYTVLWAPNLRLPDPGAQVTAAQLAGQGALMLMAEAAAAALGRVGDRFGVLVLDEAWALLSTPSGVELVSTLARDGRKRGMGLVVASQSPDDFPDAIRDQLAYRAVFNVDRGEHESALEFLGVPQGSDAVGLLSSDGGGACVLRDRQGRVGPVQTLMPAGAAGEAIDTTAAHYVRPAEGVAP